MRTSIVSHNKKEGTWLREFERQVSCPPRLSNLDMVGGKHNGRSEIAMKIQCERSTHETGYICIFQGCW